MAIHDTSRWDPRHLWSTHSQLEQNRIQSDPSWLRFSTVRNPATRLWSAWQSKLLLQEPRFVQRFGDLPWFPHRVGTVDEIVEAFREFVHALDVAPHEAPHDAHWGPQALLIEPFDLNFVGRSEQMDETMRRLVAHVGERAGVATDVPRENATPIPYHRSVYDAATAGIVNRLFEADFLAFGYPMLDDNQAPRVNEWRAAATVQVPVARQLVDRHLRIGELLAALAESERTRRRRMARLEERIRDLEEAKRQADQLVSEMERSRSWRLTRSLRTFRRR
jgi:hypothetical protein